MPPPIPQPPHVKTSIVLKIMQQGGEPELLQGGNSQWPPNMPIDPNQTRPHGHMTRCANTGVRGVTWPPHFSGKSSQNPDDTSQRHEDRNLDQGESAEQGENPQGEQGLNMTTTYPSGFKLKDEVPVNQLGQQTIPSQPAFKLTKPMKVKGDANWPPSKQGADMTEKELQCL